jgi:hypothetical protein
VAFRFIAGNEHPDHDTIANFRKRFLPQIEKIEKQLKREVQQLLRLAERADGVNVPDGMSIPEEHPTRPHRCRRWRID